MFASWPAIASNQPDSSPKADPPRVTYAGTLELPKTAADADGKATRITGVSGITWLGDDRYAAVMDNSDLVLTFTLRLSPSGEPVAIDDLVLLRLAERHDYEDLAPCPDRLLARISARQRRRGLAEPSRCLLVSEEDTPAIRAISLDDGSLLGVVPLPKPLDQPRANRGLEALAVDPEGFIWTANEEALPVDGPAAVDDGTVVRIARIPIPRPEGPAGAPRQHAYAVEPPHAFTLLLEGPRFSGVVALTALGEGRLLVLERSGGAGLPPFENRIAFVDTANAADVSGIDGALATHRDQAIAKQILWRDQLGCNLEGLCLGPSLAARSRALIVIADNGGIGGPTMLVTFRMSE